MLKVENLLTESFTFVLLFITFRYFSLPFYYVGASRKVEQHDEASCHSEAGGCASAVERGGKVAQEMYDIRRKSRGWKLKLIMVNYGKGIICKNLWEFIFFRHL